MSWPELVFNGDDRQTEGLEDEDKSLVMVQQEFETLYAKNQLYEVLCKEFSAVTEDPFYVDVLVSIYRQKKAYVGNFVNGLSPKWGNLQTVADRLYEAVKENLLNFDPATDRLSRIYKLDAADRRTACLCTNSLSPWS